DDAQRRVDRERAAASELERAGAGQGRTGAQRMRPPRELERGARGRVEGAGLGPPAGERHRADQDLHRAAVVELETDGGPARPTRLLEGARVADLGRTGIAGELRVVLDVDGARGLVV